MTLIVTKSREELRLGRFTLVADELERVVYVTSKAGGAASRGERASIEQFLRYSRPDIVREGVRTGWAIQFSVDLPLGGANTDCVDANSDVSV